MARDTVSRNDFMISAVRSAVLQFSAGSAGYAKLEGQAHGVPQAYPVTYTAHSSAKACPSAGSNSIEINRGIRALFVRETLIRSHSQSRGPFAPAVPAGCALICCLAR